jgi:hypothetical protein
MTLQDEHTGTARRTQQAWASAAEVWTENIQKVADQVPGPVLPVVPTEATAVIEQWFDFTERITKVNRDYVLSVAGVLDTLGGAVRQHADAVGEAVRDQVQAVSHTAKEQVDKVAAAEREAIEAAQRTQIEAAQREQAAEREAAKQAKREQAKREQAERQQSEEREQAEREQARAARAAERAKARQARESARERYEGRTKAELAEELAQRDLPKTGNIDELIERLVDADTQ